MIKGAYLFNRALMKTYAIVASREDGLVFGVNGEFGGLVAEVEFTHSAKGRKGNHKGFEEGLRFAGGGICLSRVYNRARQHEA